MNKITLHSKGGRQVTSVPNLFIDNFMSEANGEYVKVYLQLLRMLSQGNEQFSIGSLADKLDYTEKDVHRSLNYWEKKNLLKLDYDSTNQLTGIEVNDLASPASASDATQTSSPTAEPSPATRSAAPITATEPKQHTPEELTHAAEREEIQQILTFAPLYLKRPLTSRDINFLLFWLEELTMPVDQIDELMQYCIGAGHTNFDYMNKVALDWKDRGITSLQQLSDGNDILSHSHRSILRSMGLNRANLAPAEQAFVDKWISEYNFSLDLIIEACDRTVIATGQGNFRYADGILTNWHDQGVKRIDDLQTIDKAHQQSGERKGSTSRNQAKATHSKTNQFNNFNQRPADEAFYNQLVQQMIHS